MTRNERAEFLALLDLTADPEPGFRYPTIDDYTDALARLKREEVRLRSSVRPVLPPDPKPKPTPQDLLANALAAPPSPRQIALDAQAMRNTYVGRRANVYLGMSNDTTRAAGWQLVMNLPSGQMVELAGQHYPRERRDLAEGALALFQTRQPHVDFAIIAE